MTEAVVSEVEAKSSAGAEPEKFDFDFEFQSRLAALTMRDSEFLRRTAHLLRPELFEDTGHAALAMISLRHFERHGCALDTSTIKMAIADAAKAKLIAPSELPLLTEAVKAAFKESLVSRSFVEEKVGVFCREQAVSAAILSAVDLLGKGDFSAIEAKMNAALQVGVSEDGQGYSYYEEIEARTETRLDRAAGKLPPRGITTGIKELDDKLYHRGWGRRELTSLMGGAKAGKTTALINFAKNASLAGHNVLYCTLEVAASIISERLDASISDNMMKELEKKIHDVRSKVEAVSKRAGKLMIHEYPSGTMKPAMLRRLLDTYRAKGVTFDMVVVDYADIMAPDFRTNDVIENSKQVYIGLRAVAQEYDVAMLTATQTNRAGFMATVAKAEHVSDDFNKVRTVDLLISINKTEEEAADSEARLYFAASRNQESGFTMFIKQDMARMKFITSVLRCE